MKKILAITTIRSDYNLVYELYSLLHKDDDIDLQLIVAGAHLSEKYGLSVKQIEADGFNILLKTKTLYEGDDKASRLKSGSQLMLNAVDVVADYDPDLIIYAGDREDVIAGALIGAYLEIPTMHLFAGDHVKDGHVDNPVTHATSKLSTVNIASTSQHKERLLKMGEPEYRVFNTGSIALDKFSIFKPMSKKEIRKKLAINSGFDKFAVLIFHPVPEERAFADKILESILEELISANINTFVSYPNTDPGNFAIIDLIEKYKDNENFHIFKNLEKELFISIFKNSEFIIGNSSAGTLEAASIPIPTINVGLRQVGRFVGENVLWTKANREDISASIQKALSKEFREKIKDMKNPYGEGKSSQNVYKIIKENDFKQIVLKKDDALEV